jgi:hypothetical protein
MGSAFVKPRVGIGLWGYNGGAWRHGVGLCWRATRQGITRSGRTNDPRGSRLPLAAEPRFPRHLHSFALHYLRKLKLFFSAADSRGSLQSEVRRGPAYGDWRLPGSRRGPQASNHLLSASAAGGRTRPITYASMTLSGSRTGKRTHLSVGESNSCPGVGRSFLQSRSSGSPDASNCSPFLHVAQ